MKKAVINILNDKFDAQSLITINDLLELKTAEELKKLEQSLNELVTEFIVLKTKKDKYILYKNCPYLKIGKLSVNKSGNAFLLQEKDDIYVDYHNLNGAVNNDEVLVEIITYKGKTEGKVLKIIKRETKNLIGEIEFRNNKPILKLDDSKKRLNIELDLNTIKDCVDGSKVLVNIFKQNGINKYLGKVVHIIGHKNDPGVDIKSIAIKYNFFESFSKESLEQTEKIPIMVAQEELIDRKDLTNEVIFTIDGIDTKDIDDAISIKYEKGIYTLGVHIADVSHYILKDSPLDKDAFNRGTSAYLANSVIPMIPHKLSNGICSLNPNVIRLTISCVMEIDSNGNIIKYDIFPSYIKSIKQMDYQKVNDILMRNIIAEGYEDYVKILKTMNELAKILRKNKINRGYIDFDIDEAKLIIDSDGKCINVEKYIREDGEKLIEDFMIAANETVANYIFNMDLPFVYRIHGTPLATKIEGFIHLVNLMGYTLTGKFKQLNPKSLQKILSQLSDKPQFPFLSSILLRSMQKAVYSKENIGHFGLGSKCYTHFTSPIRRYPDLIVHRLLHTYIFDKNINKEVVNYWESNLDYITENCSLREQAAEQAEREVEDMKMAEYMEKHIGEIYEGCISSVTNYGMYVRLDNLVEGLVHINTLEKDYYNYIPELMAIVGQKTKKRYQIGDKLKIKVVASNKELMIIDFVLLDGDKRGNNKQKSIL